MKNDTEKSLGQINAEAMLGSAWEIQHPAVREAYETGAQAVKAAVLSRQQTAPVSLSDDEAQGVWNRAYAPVATLSGGEWHQGMVRGIAAILAHAPAAQPAAVSAPLVLGDAAREEVIAAAMKMWTQRDTGTVREVVDYAVAETLARLSPAPVVPAYFETAKRPPTAEDGDCRGNVRAWFALHTPPHWSETHRSNVVHGPDKFPYWGNSPDWVAPAPQRTAEDEAFDAYWCGVTQDGTGRDCDEARDIWNAAKAFFTKEGK